MKPSKVCREGHAKPLGQPCTTCRKIIYADRKARGVCVICEAPTGQWVRCDKCHEQYCPTIEQQLRRG